MSFHFVSPAALCRVVGLYRRHDAVFFKRLLPAERDRLRQTPLRLAKKRAVRPAPHCLGDGPPELCQDKLLCVGVAKDAWLSCADVERLSYHKRQRVRCGASGTSSSSVGR